MSGLDPRFPRRPRVLHVAEALIAGVATAVGDYVRHDFAEHFVLGHTRGVPLEKRIATCATEYIALPPGHIQRIRAVRDTVGGLRPDIVHAHSSWGGAYARLSFASPKRLVYSPHCFGFERQDLNAIARGAIWAAEAVLATRTGTFGVVSDREATLAKRLPGRTKIQMVPYSISDEIAPKARASPPPRALRVVSSGRVSPQKDPAFFGLAAEADRRAGGRNDWIWVGGGDPALEKDLQRRGVKVTGLLNRNDALHQIQSSDVYVHTALWEGFPIAVIEAAGLGLPIVVRASPSVLDTDLELVQTPNEIVTAIRRLEDLELWERSIERSRSLAARFTRDVQRRALIELYASILNPRSALGE